MGNMYLVFWKSTLSSSSVTDDITLYMMLIMVWIVPLWGGWVAAGEGGVDWSSGWELRKKVTPALLCVWDSEKQESSLRMLRYILLTIYQTVTAGLVVA
jgi:hypothetical protein